ncbi:Amino acid/polyamine transporter I [Trinorchestia longiramus]|nr:Amino acid/polyamine transporter I [Trinorchestia longiramus]
MADRLRSAPIELAKGEEAVKPERNLPLSICLSLFVIFLSYFSLGTVLTLALPYCELDNEAPLVKLYEHFDMNTSKIIVSVGALFGFSASLFGAIFPMPRIIYAMASDGLLFRWLAVVNERFRSPIIATFVSGGFAAVMATFFDLEALINMMSIGTLQAYSIVALCVMLLRYSDDPHQCCGPYPALYGDYQYSIVRYAEDPADKELEQLSEKITSKSSLPQYRSSVVSKSSGASVQSFSWKSYLHQALNPTKLEHPTPLSASYVAWATVVFCILCFILCILLVVLADELADLDPVSMFFCILFFGLGIFVVTTIYLQPQSSVQIQFKSPFVPWLPAASCFFNLYLMCNLPPNTWVKFIIWLAVGLAIYFFYGICHADNDATTMGKKSTGEANQAFEGDAEEPVIPKILVQPATPLPSVANTPNSTMLKNPPPVVRKSSREAVISPLVTAELAQKKLQEEEERARREAGNGEVKLDVEDDQVIVPKDDLVVASAPPSQAMFNEKELISALANVDPDENRGFSNEDVTAEPTSNDGELYGASPLVAGVAIGVDGHKANSNEDSDLEKKISEAGTSETHMNESEIKNSSSAPVMPLKSASIGRLAKVASEESMYGDERAPYSVPSTPVTKRAVNFNKPLRRMSSFDYIPPSSPTDPLAKNINGFCVIPVKELEFDVDDHKIRKTSSLDEIVKRSNEKDFVQTSSEPIITDNTREFTHGLGQELGKESIELGVIRERGESKLLANGETFYTPDGGNEGRDKNENVSESGSVDAKVASAESNKSSQVNNSQEESFTIVGGVETQKIASDGSETNNTDELRPYFDLGTSSSVESLQTMVTNSNKTGIQSPDDKDPKSSSQLQSINTSSVVTDVADAKHQISSDSVMLIETREPETPLDTKIKNDSTPTESGRSERTKPVSSSRDSNLQESIPVDNTLQSFGQTDTAPKDASAPMTTNSSSIKNLMQKFSVLDDSIENVPRETVKIERDSNVSELRNKFQ